MRFDAAILAGGKAARFGHRPKGLAVVGGKRVVDRQLEVLEGVADRIAIVGDNLDPFATIGGVAFIADVCRGSGPLAGIAAALAWSATPWVFVVAGDMPLVDGPLVTALCALTGDDVAMVAPRVGGRVHPLAAFYNKSAQSEIATSIENQLLSPSRLFDEGARLASRTLIVNDARALNGFNDEAELEAIRQLVPE